MLTKKGIKALLKVRVNILNEPTKFDMCKWFIDDSASPCGTAACIGGWLAANDLKAKTLKQARVSIGFRTVEAMASEVLGTWRTGTLFFSDSWDEPFKTEYREAMIVGDRKLAARIAADYIVHWIEQKISLKYTDVFDGKVELPKYIWLMKGKDVKRN